MRRLLFALALLLPGLAAAQVCGPRIGKLPSFTVVSRPTASAPTFSPAAGSYSVGQVVTISTTSGDGLIRFTTNGTDPTDSTPGCGLSSCSVTLSASVTIKAITSQSGATTSAVVSSTYTLSGPGTGPSYYADSVNGTDSGPNPCTSQATPCKTIARVLAVNPPTNSTIWLKHGSKWREDITGLASGVSVKAYGTDLRPATDNRPLLDASDVVTNAGWSKTAGRTYVYERTWTLPAGYYHGVYENGVRLTRVADLATCDSTASSYYAPTQATGGADVVYIHPAANLSPITNGKLYEMRKRTGVIGAFGGTIQGIRARRNSNPNGSILSYYYAKDCLAEDGVKHNFWVNGLCEDCVARYNEPPGTYGGATLFVTYPTPGLPSPSHTQGAIYRRSQAIGESDGLTLGFYAHTSGGAEIFDRVIYDGCSASNLAAGYGGGGSVDYSVFHNSTATNCVIGSSASPTVALVWLGGCMVMPGNNASESGISNNPPASPAITVRGLSYFSNGGNGAAIKPQQAATVDVSRSTFVHYGAAQFSGSVVSLAGSTTASTSARNVFYGGWQIYDPASGNSIASSDYNVFWGGSNLNTSAPSHYDNFRMPTQYTTFALYRAAYPALDANSQSADPLLNGDPYSCDMSTASGSPANTLQAGSFYQPGDTDATQVSLWATYGVPPAGWIGPTP